MDIIVRQSIVGRGEGCSGAALETYTRGKGKPAGVAGGWERAIPPENGANEGIARDADCLRKQRQKKQEK